MLIASRLGRKMSVAIAKQCNSLTVACLQMITITNGFVSEKVLFRMASRKRTRSENRETKSQESPMKNPPIVKVGFMLWLKYIEPGRIDYCHNL